MKPSLILAAFAVLLAGCTGAVEEAAPLERADEDSGEQKDDTVTVDDTAPATGPADPVVPRPRVLYLTGDGGFSETPPASETHVSIVEPVNGPWVNEYPYWEGVLPWNVAPAGAQATLTLYVTANTASAGTGAVPGFPDMGVRVTLGNGTVEVPVDGPDVLLAGEVAEVAVTVPVAAEELPPGSLLRVTAIVYYTHVHTAAEFRYVLSPDHPARIELST